MKQKLIAAIFLISIVCPSVLAQQRVPYKLEPTYPPWWHEGHAYGSHGFPVEVEILALPSLTAKQQSDIRDKYAPSQRQVDQAKAEIQTLMKRRNVMSVAEYQEKMRHLWRRYQHRCIDGWRAVKPILSPKQLQELRQMCEESANGSHYAPSGVNSYQ